MDCLGDTVKSALSRSLGHKVLHCFPALLYELKPQVKDGDGHRHVLLSMLQASIATVDTKGDNVLLNSIPLNDILMICLPKDSADKASIAIELKPPHFLASKQRFRFLMRLRCHFLDCLFDTWNTLNGGFPTKQQIRVKRESLSFNDIIQVTRPHVIKMGFNRFVYKNYIFCLPKEYVQYTNDAYPDCLTFSRSGASEFEDPEELVIVWVSPASSDKEVYEKFNLYHGTSPFQFNLRLEQFAESFIGKHDWISLADSEVGRLLPQLCDSGHYKKSSGDPSLWWFHDVSIVSETKTASVAGARLQFLPPFLDRHQEIMICHVRKRAKDDLKEVDGRAIAKEAVASLCAYESEEIGGQVLPLFEVESVQTKLDHLGYSMFEFSWFEKNFGMLPQSEFIGMKVCEVAHQFSRAIVELLPRRTGVLTSTEISSKLHDLGYISNPLDIIFRVESGLPGNASDDAISRLLHLNWKRQVCTFLSFYIAEQRNVDGTLLSLKSIIRSITEMDSQHNAQIFKVIDYLLYIREYNQDFAFEMFTRQKLEMALRGSFSCNEEVLVLIFEIDFELKVDFLKESLQSEGMDAQDASKLLALFYAALLDKNYNLELFALVCQKLKSLARTSISTKIIDPLLQLYESDHANVYLKSYAADALASLISKVSIEQQTTSGILSANSTAISYLNNTCNPYLVYSSFRIVSQCLSAQTSTEAHLQQVMQTVQNLFQRRIQSKCSHEAILKECSMIIL